MNNTHIVTPRAKTQHIRVSVLCLLSLLAIGMETLSYSEVQQGNFPQGLFSKDLPGLDQLMGILSKVNVRQMDRNSKEIFDDFFERRNQMNESVQLLERKTAASQTVSGHSLGHERPKRIHYRAY